MHTSGVSYCDSEIQLDEIQDNKSSLVVSKYNGNSFCESSYKSSSASTYKMQLEQDVQRLKQQLQEEVEMHAILENALEQNAIKSLGPSCLTHHAQELLSNIEMLESSVSKLEEELISLHFQLSQERNERRLAEYHWRRSKCQSLGSCPDITKAPEAVETAVFLQEKKVLVKLDASYCKPVHSGRFTREVQPRGLWDHPCKLSEEMVRCMKNIFISLADSTIPSKSSTSGSHSSSLSPRGHLSNMSTGSISERSTISSCVQSPQIDLQCDTEVLAAEDTVDPYRVRGKLSWTDIGSYGSATEVSWMSVGKKQLEYAAGALRKFRTLVEQLAQVNPNHLSSSEKLAFWINLYNALIMHAYLAYGVPKSDLKLFSLMQKAAYTVGGHSFSAAVIEYVILKMKPPVHRPQIALLLALHKLKVSDEQKDLAVNSFEPLVVCALSCGMYSSPAIRIYTAKNVKDELQEAQHDFIRASVGVSSKGKLLVPKMIHSFAKGFVDDEKLAVWISHYLPSQQAAFVEKCMSKRRQSILSSRNCGIVPFDSRFRYLFLPEKSLPC
ncbi:unnamed protein product [Ilex paraguariensis]|uniref:DUF547 domain-containing protein n=1 Tax=Ilex paraguariensis TaxID=185542 RepID=A0ABC8RNZ0_9AQUA